MVTDTRQMFNQCKVLTSFRSYLPKLQSGGNMFSSCPQLKSFNCDMPELTSAAYMFGGCTSLTSFSNDVSKVSAGKYMFNQCSKLTSFSSDLPMLSDGTGMFNQCKLDKASALRVLNTIPAYTSGTHSLTLGMASALNGDADITAALTAASNKGWTVTTQYN